MSAPANACPRCSRDFDCGIGTGTCWCAGVDVAETMRAALAQYYDGCLCPECLQSLDDERPQVPTVRAFLASQLKRKRRART
jgi:hypothetical protein